MFWEVQNAQELHYKPGLRTREKLDIVNIYLRVNVMPHKYEGTVATPDKEPHKGFVGAD